MALFAKSAPSVRDTYDAILKASRAFGPVVVEPKKTSIHLVRWTAFAGIWNRWHIEIRMASPKEIDKEVRGWLKGGWELVG